MENNNFDIVEIKEKAVAYIKKKNISQNEFANRCGASSTAINQFINSKYSGDRQALAKKIDDFLSLEIERSVLKNDFNFIETTVSIMVEDGLRFAELMKKIVLITSPPGFGKTYALKNYASKARHLFLTMRPTTTMYPLMYELAERLGVSVRNNSDMILRRVTARLKERPKTLVLDEAQHLNHKTLDCIRHIWDMAGVPIVICGNDELIEEFKKEPRLAKFMSRLQWWQVNKMITFEQALKIVHQRFPKISDPLAQKLYKSSPSVRYLADLVLALDIFTKMNDKTVLNSELIEQLQAFKFAA